MRSLSELERRWAHEIFDAIYPAGVDPRLPYGVRDCDIDGYLDECMATWPMLTIIGFRATVFAVGLASIVLLRTWRTFSRLSTDERVRVLTMLYANNLYVVRQLVILMKVTAGIVYGSTPKVRAPLMLGAIEGPKLYGAARVAKET
ncbi:MAG: hypothetical protein WCJ30_19590 [Deltaproteobacteria bacterium]